MRCADCGGRLMYRTRITIDPYGFSSAWVCPVCEQQKTALAGGYRNGERMGRCPEKVKGGS
jgi:hypothetical protein